MEDKKVRWRYIVDRSFQNQFMLRFSLIVILVVLVTLGLLWVIQKNPYSQGLLPAPVLYSMTDKVVKCSSPDGAQFELNQPGQPFNAFQLWWKPILIVGGLNLLLIVVFSLFYSHSMAGPIHNIKVSIASMIEGGEARPIRVRKGDQFQDLADLLNQLIEKRVK